ncbi:MAG: TRAP transporter small permease subunit [Caldisericia bacterium]|nr:TRAP transporter small permease subunit [Caldisericia bacterium]
MRKIFEILDSFSIRINLLIYRITGSLILINFAIVLYGVFFRYVLNNPLAWVLPISRIILVWTGLLGISIAFKEGEHVGLKFVLFKFPKKIITIILYLDYFLISIYLFILIWKGFPIALQATELIMISSKLQIQLKWSLLAVPISAVINLIHILPLPILVNQELRLEKKEEF